MGQQLRGAPPLAGQPQAGFDPRFGPGGPNGPNGPGGPGDFGGGGGQYPGGPGPFGPGGSPVRKRITDAFAWLGARPQGPDVTTVDGESPAGWGASGNGPGPAQATWGGGAPAEPNGVARPAGAPSGTRNKVLIAGAGVLVVLAIGAVAVTPKVFGSSSDPGCKAYSGTTLTAYNKTIGDLNSQSSQQTLTTDMAATVTDLNGAIAQAQSASVKSALHALLTELKTVQSDVGSGSVPSPTVSALNTASTAADKAC